MFIICKIRRFSITDKHLSEADHYCSRSILTIFIIIIQKIIVKLKIIVYLYY